VESAGRRVINRESRHREMTLSVQPLHASSNPQHAALCLSPLRRALSVARDAHRRSLPTALRRTTAPHPIDTLSTVHCSTVAVCLHCLRRHHSNPFDTPMPRSPTTHGPARPSPSPPNIPTTHNPHIHTRATKALITDEGPPARISRTYFVEESRDSSAHDATTCMRS